MNKDIYSGHPMPFRDPILRLLRWASGLLQGARQAALAEARALAIGDQRWCFNFSEAADGGHSIRPNPRSGGAADRAKAGDPPTIDALYRKYSPSLYWVCMRYTRSKEDAEDMVQQVFVKVHKNLDGFRGQSNVYTWMYRIAINECLHLFRKRKFDAEGSPEEMEHLVPVYPEREMDAKLDLQSIMAETDPQTVEILFLLYMEGLTQEEVVAALGISRTTVNRKVAAFKATTGRFQ